MFLKEQQFYDAGYRIYQKTLEIQLSATNKDYSLDKYQSLNNKPIRKLIIPPFYGTNPTGGFPVLPPYNFGAATTAEVYITPPQSPSGFALAAIEAIDGAYLKFVNMVNQNVADITPLSFFKNDTTIFSDKGLFIDTPKIDFTQSKIFYPTLNIPVANDSKAILIVVEYWDVWKETNALKESTTGGFPV